MDDQGDVMHGNSNVTWPRPALTPTGAATEAIHMLTYQEARQIMTMLRTPGLIKKLADEKSVRYPPGSGPSGAKQEP